MNCCLPIRRLTAAALFSTVACLCAQTINVPRPADNPAGEVVPYKMFDATHLKDRPYNFNLPKPQFPSTERVQREFVVEYVYEYALSKYSPEVPLPVTAALAAKRDTPEDALIAFFSAIRSGDYEAWLQCWDETGQKQLQQAAKDRKQDAAYWKKLWKDSLAGVKDVILTDRVETEHYVILDIRLTGASQTKLPTVLKYVDRQWFVTNELTANPMLYKFNPTLAGILNLVPPEPVAVLDQDNRQQIQTQQRFLDDHGQRDRTVLAGN